MRKVNAERVFTLLKSVITCELERNGSENNLLFIIKSLVPTILPLSRLRTETPRVSPCVFQIILRVFAQYVIKYAI